MIFHFDEIVDRKQSQAIKWDVREKLFGSADVIPLWVADMDFPAPPAVRDALIKRAEHGIYGYTSRSVAAQEAIIAWWQRRHHWAIRREWMLQVPGVVPALSMLVATLTQPGDAVLIQPPVYPPFFEVIERNGRTVVESPLVLEDGRYRIDFADLEEKLAGGVKMMILCSPHNPVGRVWRQEELHRLGELCLRHDVMLVSDEIHADLVYAAHRHVPVASLSEALSQQTITCISPGKTFNLAGLQTASVIIPRSEWRTAMKEALHTLHLTTDHYFAGAAVEAAYRHGESWLEALQQYLEGNRRLVADYLETRLRPMRMIEPEGTYLIWLDCRELGMSRDELKRWFNREAKVGLNEGASFGQGGEGFMRMNIACPLVVLTEALERIALAMERRRTGGE